MPKLTKPPKRRNRFGEPPPAQTDIRKNLAEPEVAPSADHGASMDDIKSDGRTLRVTGRTIQFATRVHPEWKAKLYRLSQQTKLMYVEILERALEAFERELDKK